MGYLLRQSVLYTSALASVLTCATATAAPLHSGYVLIEPQRLAETATDLNQLIVREVRGRTVVQGLQEILADTGYRLADEFAADPDLFRLYTQPYPGHKRTLGPAALAEMLIFVAGPAWRLVHDPVNRVVSFERHEDYFCGRGTARVCPGELAP